MRLLLSRGLRRGLFWRPKGRSSDPKLAYSVLISSSGEIHAVIVARTGIISFQQAERIQQTHCRIFRSLKYDRIVMIVRL